jgi:U32 family peptidase
MPGFQLGSADSSSDGDDHIGVSAEARLSHSQSPHTSLRMPELLSPAGDDVCVRAAVENGADAVYFGLHDGFNARARATNFALHELRDIMHYLHERAVRGYVTLNTLAFTDELSAMERVVRNLAIAGVDALLIQDLGVARLIREICPEMTLHASTQMTITSAECLEVARELGIQRVVLARELSIPEIRRIHSQTDMELEVFVHGALCVAYSGQCLTSEALGGRSANRGQCAQACRLPYELVSDDQLIDLGDQKYLLSPQDLAAFSLTAELIEAGVSSFKIEGRLKTPEYVANITRHYREAIDAAVAGRPLDFSRRQIQRMEQSFSRGFSPGWLKGCDHKMLVPALSSSKRGVLLGTVTAVHHDRVSVELEYSVAAGDGVVFEGDRITESEIGGRVFEVFRQGIRQKESVDSGRVDLAFDHHGVDLRQLYAGQKLWKTDDPRLNQQLRRSFESADAIRRVPLEIHVNAAQGQPLTIEATAVNGTHCRITSDEPLKQAEKHPLTRETLQQQLSRLGSTVYELRKLTAEISGQPMVPLSVLGLLRRQMIEALATSIPQPIRLTAEEGTALRMRAAVISTDWPQQHAPTPATGSLPGMSSDSGNSPGTSEITLSILCRTLAQLSYVVRSAADARPETRLPDSSVDVLPKFLAIADFQDIREYRQAAAIAQEFQIPVLLATPRIQKPDEMGIFRMMQKHASTGVLVRNLSGLRFFHEQSVPVVGDFSLNVTNELTAEFLMQQGCSRVTASYDLNRDQLLDLVNVIPSAWLEVVIHQHMPMFHMEHCVFCAVLSPGTNKTNCGRPCDVHKVELRDRTGIDHPLVADVGCRNTLFNAVPQSSAEIVPELLNRGIRHFRIELLRESPAEIAQVLNLYPDLLQQKINGSAVWKALNAANQVGVTRGTLEARSNPLPIL